MSDPLTAAVALKNTFKEPLFYVIAFFVGAGTWLVKDTESLNSTWVLGLCMIIFGGIVFIVQLVNSLMDSSFARRYKELIDAQNNLISSQQESITNISKTSIAAHETMTSAGFSRQGDTTETSTR